MKAELILTGLLVASIYGTMSLYQDKVEAELRADEAESSLAKAVRDTNATKASYKSAIDKIEKIRKEAENAKCNLKTLGGGVHHFPI